MLRLPGYLHWRHWWKVLLLVSGVAHKKGRCLLRAIMAGSWPAHRPGPTNVWFDHYTACNKLPSNLSLRTPLNYRQFVWSQNCQKSHIPYHYNTDTSVFHSSPPFFEEKFAGGANKSRQIWIVIWMQTINDSHWLRKAFALSLIGYTSTCENSCALFWLAVEAFSHVKAKRIDFYK